jgi:hypothetical protein
MKFIRARDVKPGDIIRNGNWLDRVSSIEDAPIWPDGRAMVWIRCNDDTTSTCRMALDWIEVARD